MGKGSFLDNLVMEVIGRLSPMLEYLDVPIGHAIPGRSNFHDHVVLAKAADLGWSVNEFAKFMLGVNIKDKYTLVIQMALYGSKCAHPITESQQMIYRIIGTDDGIKGPSYFEPGHVLMEEIYIG